MPCEREKTLTVWKKHRNFAVLLSLFLAVFVRVFYVHIFAVGGYRVRVERVFLTLRVFF